MCDFIANNIEHQWESPGEIFQTFSQGISLALVSAKEYLLTKKDSDRKYPSCFPGCLCFYSCIQMQCIYTVSIHVHIHTQQHLIYLSLIHKDVPSVFSYFLIYLLDFFITFPCPHPLQADVHNCPTSTILRLKPSETGSTPGSEAGNQPTPFAMG